MKLISYSLSLIIFGVLIFGYIHPINSITQDLGRHLKTGEIIVNTLSVPKVNLYSYTYPDFPFINHHWFSEVIYYFIFQLSDFNGLLIISTSLVLLAFLNIYFLTIKKTNIFTVAITSALYLSILFERTDVRPEIFSFLFTSLFITTLYSYKNKFSLSIFLLLLLQLLWTNIHIYFIIGPVLVFLFLLDHIYENKKEIFIKKIISYKTKVLLVVFFLISLTTMINPNFINGAIYPFRVFQNYGYSIEENQNIFFLEQLSVKNSIFIFKITFVTYLLLLIIFFKKTRLLDWLLFLIFSYFAVTAIRNFPLFVFATFFSFSSLVYLFLEKLKNVLPKNFKSYYYTILLIIFMLLITQSTKKPLRDSFGLGIEVGAKNAVDFYIKNNIQGPVFNNFDIGSYLDYRLYPKQKVFVDGRPEAYPASFFQNVYIPMQQEKNIFDKEDKVYKFNSIFFSHTDQTPWSQKFLREVVNSNTWKIVYLDNLVIILLKDNVLNKALISKYSITEDSYTSSKISPNNLYSLLHFAIFFNTVGWTNHELETYKKIIEIDPHNCPVLNNIVLLLQQQSSPFAGIYQYRLDSVCR